MVKKRISLQSLTLVECMEFCFERVLDHERPVRKNATLYAVFAVSLADGLFCGLVSRDDIARHPEWVFADLVEHRRNQSIVTETPVQQVLDRMIELGVDALPVLDSEGGFRGVVTRTGILFRLFKREGQLLKETTHLNQQVERDRKQLAAWSSRLSDLLTASRTLLGVLAHTSIETDLLQHGIEALTKLLNARYGAIGIVDENGVLCHFCYIGVSAEVVKEIGLFPQGKGLLGAVIQENCAIRLADLSQDSRSVGFPDGHPPMKSLLAVPISHGGHVYGRVYLCDRKDGDLFSPDDELLAMSFSNSLSLVLENAREIKEMERTQQRLDYLVHFDGLTGLPNRELLTDRIQQMIAHSKRYSRQMALMFVDVDNFKSINDAFGHRVGDELLKSVAAIFSMATREGDTVARLGGDEFVVALPEIHLVEDAAFVAEKMMNAVREPILLKGVQREVFITVSVGISLLPQDGEDMDTLMSRADAAMYQSKSSGKNTFRFFTNELNTEIQIHLKLEQHLQQALREKELSLHYQPQVDVESQQIIGVEALLRWHNYEIGTICPADFIPVAEETGLIIPIGAWVIRKACEQAVKWHKSGFPVRIAVNVSVHQFQYDQSFIAMIRAVLEETGMDSRYLELEITESLRAQKIEETIEIIETLKGLGLRVSMDDFGTGYSSLSYLKRLPIDAVKIDQSFIRDITTDRNNAAIVLAITAMAKQLDLQVIAEGVETREQLEIIRAHHCHVVQGYYFSRPINADEMTDLLQQGIPFPLELVKGTDGNRVDGVSDPWADAC